MATDVRVLLVAKSEVERLTGGLSAPDLYERLSDDRSLLSKWFGIDPSRVEEFELMGIEGFPGAIGIRMLWAGSEEATTGDPACPRCGRSPSTHLAMTEAVSRYGYGKICHVCHLTDQPRG